VTADPSPDVEFIVVDGDSTDGSKDLLKKYASGISLCISEPDKGIYDAQNKGAMNAKGEYLLFLNGGDVLYSKETISQLLKATENNKGIIYGNSEIVNSKGRELLRSPGKLETSFWYMGTLNHQAVLFRKNIFQKYGPYDLQYSICADFDLLLNVFLKEPLEFFHTETIVCSYDETGFSAAPSNFEKMISEHKAILKKRLGEKEFDRIEKEHRNKLPANERFRAFMYDRNWTKKLFLFAYRTLKN
jgi:glycosyltransferase involved in cell wall biosynthesis